MTEPTAADRERAAELRLYGYAVQADRIAAALAAAREEGRNEIRAKVETLADEFDTGGVGRFTPGYAADRLRATVVRAQPESNAYPGLLGACSHRTRLDEHCADCAAEAPDQPE